jgi:hypothetical protein
MYAAAAAAVGVLAFRSCCFGCCCFHSSWAVGVDSEAIKVTVSQLYILLLVPDTIPGMPGYWSKCLVDSCQQGNDAVQYHICKRAQVAAPSTQQQHCQQQTSENPRTLDPA